VLWIPGLWALLVAMGKPRRAVALCMTAVVFNGFHLPEHDLHLAEADRGRPG